MVVFSHLFFTASSLPEARVAGLVPGTGKEEKESLLGDEEGREVEECATDVAHYSIYSLQKLQQLNEKLAHKHDALKALTASGQHNPKVRHSPWSLASPFFPRAIPLPQSSLICSPTFGCSSLSF